MNGTSAPCSLTPRELDVVRGLGKLQWEGEREGGEEGSAPKVLGLGETSQWVKPRAPKLAASIRDGHVQAERNPKSLYTRVSG